MYIRLIINNIFEHKCIVILSAQNLPYLQSLNLFGTVRKSKGGNSLPESVKLGHVTSKGRHTMCELFFKNFFKVYFFHVQFNFWLGFCPRLWASLWFTLYCSYPPWQSWDEFRKTSQHKIGWFRWLFRIFSIHETIGFVLPSLACFMQDYDWRNFSWCLESKFSNSYI